MLFAEAIVSSCGVSRALGDKPKPPTGAELKRAHGIEDEIAERTKELVGAVKASGKVEPAEVPDYRETHKRLLAKIDGDHLAELLLPVQPELQPACSAVWSNAVMYLDGIFPRRSEDTLVGPKLHDPSKGELAEFGWAWRVANKHLAILDLMTDGVLIGAEVFHVKSMFPTIHALICGKILDALSAKVAADKEWIPPWWLQKQICTLLDVSPISKTLLADIESAVQASQKQAQQRANDIKANAQLATPAQRLEAK